MDLCSVCGSPVSEKLQPFYLCINVCTAFRLTVEVLFSLFLPQVLRTHVMVRVGGGWDTLEHYLDKHDPCRCAAFGEVTNSFSSAPYKDTSLWRFTFCIIHGAFQKVNRSLTSNVRCLF